MRLLDNLPRAKLAEGPIWDDAAGALYWVDIAGHAIHRHEPASGAHATHPLEDAVGFCALAGDGGLVAGIGGAVQALRFGEAESLRELARPAMDPGNRFNDGKCDPAGRLWAGTMHVEAHRDREPTGALYRWHGGALEQAVAPVSLANGLGWSPDGGTMYFSDTHAGTIWAYDYDLVRGTIGARRAFAAVPVEEGVPDGLTVDAAGRVIVAVWRGGRLDVFAPDGSREASLAVPVRNPTSCAFGGAGLRTLYVTTMPSSGETDPRSGSLFALEMERPGLAASRADLGL